MSKNKIVSADEAAAIIRDRDTVCTSGFVGVGTPDELLIALEKRYRESRHPSALTLMFAAAPGDARDRGLNRLAHDPLQRLQMRIATNFLKGRVEQLQNFLIVASLNEGAGVRQLLVDKLLPFADLPLLFS